MMKFHFFYPFFFAFIPSLVALLFIRSITHANVLKAVDENLYYLYNRKRKKKKKKEENKATLDNAKQKEEVLLLANENVGN